MALTAAENLKQKLLLHLDNENNVVNERGVLEAMTLWEAYPVTREILEVTRIGKFVNELRKKTTNKSLARRAKDLVRKWQSAPSAASVIDTTSLIVPSQLPATSVTNGNLQLTSGSRTYSPSVSLNPDSLLKAKVKPVIASSSSSPVPTQLDRTDLRNKHSGRSPVPSMLDRTSPDIRHKTSHDALTDSRLKSSNSLASQLDRNSSDLRKISNKSLLTSQRGTPSYSESRGSPSFSGVDVKSAFSSAVMAEDSQSVASSIASLTDAGSRSCSPSGFSVAVHRAGNQEKYQTSSSQRKRLRGDGGAAESGDVSEKKKVKLDASTTSAREKSHCEVTGNGAFSKITSDIAKRDLVPQTISSKNVSSPSLNGHRLDHRKSNLLINDNSNSTSPRVTEVVNGFHRSSSPMMSDRSTVPRPSTSKLRKVETTAELMNKLHASGELRLWRSETIEKIASGQIAKEKDCVGGPVVPASALPRPHKSSRGGRQSVASPSLNVLPPATPAGGLGKVKTEMVHKFLQMSVPDSSPMTSSEPSGSDPTGLLARLEHEPKPDEMVTFDIGADKQKQNNHQAKSKRHQHIKSDEISTVESTSKTVIRVIDKASKREVVLHHDEKVCKKQSQLDLDRLDDLLPVYNPDDIDWSTTGSYECPAPNDRAPITDADIYRLHNDTIVGVNGYYDYRGEWKDWASMLTLPSYDGTFLHILPYVNVDE